MNKEAKTKWIEALRSGQYVKGEQQLCYIDSETKLTKHCCLGVLCDITPDVTKQQVNTKDFGYSYRDSAISGPQVSYLPINLRDELEITEDEEEDLVTLNDSKDNWNEVIKYIEENM